jgi:hypothetical protein
MNGVTVEEGMYEVTIAENTASKASYEVEAWAIDQLKQTAISPARLIII